MKLCNEFMKLTAWFALMMAFAAFMANQWKLAFRLVDDNTTLTGWTVEENRADYDWCHALTGRDPDVIADGMIKTEKFGNVYLFKRR